MESSDKTFYHNAGLGDIIYSLPAVRALGGGNYVVNINRDYFNAIRPLMLRQSCIRSFDHKDDVGLPKGFIDLTNFYLHHDLENTHIVNMHLRYLGLPDWDFKSFIDSSWPFNYTSFLSPYEYAVINVTPRYRDRFFNWRSEVFRLVEKYKGRVYFLGSIIDFHSFCKKYDLYPVLFDKHRTTGDLLQAAQYIQGASYFSGNESVLLAIRQGLGLRYSFEKHPFGGHCVTGTSMQKILNPHWRIHRNLSLLKKYTIGYNKNNNNGYVLPQIK